jgi:hypothetical protein
MATTSAAVLPVTSTTFNISKISVVPAGDIKDGDVVLRYKHYDSSGNADEAFSLTARSVIASALTASKKIVLVKTFELPLAVSPVVDGSNFPSEKLRAYAGYAGIVTTVDSDFITTLADASCTQAELASMNLQEGVLFPFATATQSITNYKVGTLTSGKNGVIDRNAVIAPIATTTTVATTPATTGSGLSVGMTNFLKWFLAAGILVGLIFLIFGKKIKKAYGKKPSNGRHSNHDNDHKKLVYMKDR